MSAIKLITVSKRLEDWGSVGLQGPWFSEDLIVRLNALCSKPIPVAGYTSLHRQRYSLVDNVPVDRAELLLINPEQGGIAHAIFVNPKDYKMYCHGVYYGFPTCCINMFAKWTHQNPPVYDGTGFRPCLDCCKRPVDEVLAEIAANRLAVDPFPNGDTGTPESEIHFLETFAAGKLVRPKEKVSNVR